jgi:tryptophan synthase alpha chain
MKKLESRIRELRANQEILMISHAVIGYPDFRTCSESVDRMIDAGVELIELQIPFSEPQADGPFFTAANQHVLDSGVSLKECMDFASEMCRRHPSGIFLYMTYFNILFKFGIQRFVKSASETGIKGIIVPDLPIEEASEYIECCKAEGIDPIFMFTPTTSPERMAEVAKMSSGFVYCQAREGVTGSRTKFSQSVSDYIDRCRAATSLPLAVGFGIQVKEDVDFLKGKADIAICCTQAVRALVEKGPEAMGDFLKRLR